MQFVSVTSNGCQRLYRLDRVLGFVDVKHNDGSGHTELVFINGDTLRIEETAYQMEKRLEVV